MGNIDKFLNSKASDQLTKLTELSEKQTLISEYIKDWTQDREERKKYALWTFVFLCVFTGIILSIILLSGFRQCTNFIVSEWVLVTLITTSFGTVVSIFVFVMKYLFGK